MALIVVVPPHSFYYSSHKVLFINNYHTVGGLICKEQNETGMQCVFDVRDTRKFQSQAVNFHFQI